MAWSTIRKATAEDRERLEAAAVRFLARHATGRAAWLNEASADASTLERVEELLYIWRDGERDGAYLRRLWRAAVRRALRRSDADGIAYGYVGSWVP